MTKRIAVLTGLTVSVLALSACSTYDGYGSSYGYGPGYGSGYSASVTVFDGYYDNFYGPVHGGYWGGDNYFYYQSRVGGPYVRDHYRHFRRDHFYGGNSFRFPDRRNDYRGGPPHANWRGDNRWGDDRRDDGRGEGWRGDRGDGGRGDDRGGPPQRQNETNAPRRGTRLARRATRRDVAGLSQRTGYSGEGRRPFRFARSWRWRRRTVSWRQARAAGLNN